MLSLFPLRGAYFLALIIPPLLAGFLSIASLPGCGKSPNAGDAAAKSNSLFGNSIVQTRAVIITNGQKAYALESLSIHGSPASDVKQTLAPVLTRLKQGFLQAQAAIKETEARLKKAEAQLEAASGEIDAEHQRRLPEASARPSLSQRNSVKLLEKWRAEEMAANDWREATTADRLPPIKATIGSLEHELQGLRADVKNLRSSFSDDVFRGLPAKPRKTWKTNSDGQASLEVPNSEPWIVWASSSRKVAFGDTEQYRWICLVPDDLDSNGCLFLDNENLLDARRLVTDFFDESLEAPPTFLEHSEPSR
jgi:hypothetical protein